MKHAPLLSVHAVPYGLHVNKTQYVNRVIPLREALDSF